MSNSHREFLIATAASASVLWHRSGSAHASADQGRKFAEHAWERDHRSPIVVPRSDFDASGAQGPFVVLHDAERWIFYAGIGKDGLQRTMFSTYALAEAARPDGLTSDRGTVAQPAERQTDDMSVDRVQPSSFGIRIRSLSACQKLAA